MCHTLLQVYACGHKKPVTITPCSYSLATTKSNDTRSNSPLPPYPHASSSSASVSENPFSDAHDVLHGGNYNASLPLRQASNRSLTPQSTDDRQALPSQQTAIMGIERENALGLKIDTATAAYKPQQQQQQQNQQQEEGDYVVSPISNDYNINNNNNRPPYPPSSHSLSPSPSSITLVSAQPPPQPRSPSPSPLKNSPTYCDPSIARHLPQSRYPCLACYMQPQWTELRKSWMNDYRVSHFLGRDREADVERLSGVAEIAERVGLVNVGREMERMRGEGCE